MNADTLDMNCPFCDDGLIEVEYDGESIHDIQGTCIHARQWRDNTLENKDEFTRKIWQEIENYWADRAEAAAEAQWDR